MLDECGVHPIEQAAGIVGEHRGRGERGAYEGRAPRGGQAMPHDVADDQDGGVTRPVGRKVEVAADPISGREEGRGEVHAGTLGELRWRQRVADRAAP